jgi:hypothetical protein
MGMAKGRRVTFSEVVHGSKKTLHDNTFKKKNKKNKKNKKIAACFSCMVS